MRWMRRIASTRGAMRPAQIGLLILGAALIWEIVISVPSLLHQMSLSNIATDVVAKMNINFNDELLRRDVITQAAQQGIQLNPADITMERINQPFIENRVTINWVESETTFFGGTVEKKHHVTAKVRTGEKDAKG